MKLMSLVRLDISWFFFCCKRTVVIFPALLGTLKRMRRSRGPSGSGELSRKGRHGHVGMLRFDLLIHRYSPLGAIERFYWASCRCGTPA
jgi:hypothetical protein